MRSFGSDPELVARHVAAFVRGLQGRRRRRVREALPRATARPTQDSHLELPALVGDVEAGLEPFRAAIAAGVQSIMTAHIRVHDAARDGRPARVVQGLLRDELGFDGVVIADALEMKAVADDRRRRGAPPCSRSPPGVDALCVGHDLGEDAVDRIRAALVADGRRGAAARGGRQRSPRLADWARPDAGRRRSRGRRGGSARRALARRGRRRARRPRRSSSSCGRGRTSPPARPSTALGDGGRSSARASSVPRRRRATSCATRTVTPGCARPQTSPGAIVVEIGLPVWRPDARARLRRDVRRRPRVARRRPAGLLGPVTSHLERELREQPEALARLIDKQLRLRRGDRRALPPQRRPVRPDRLARQLVERRALRAVPARPRAPRAGRVRDAVALHALRAAAAARRRARDRHLAVRRVAGRRRGRATRRSARAGRRSRSRTRPSSPLGLAADAVRAARGRAGAGRRRDEDVRQLARRDRADLRDDDRRRAGARRAASAFPTQIAGQIERSWSDVAALDELGAVDGGTVVARGINYCTVVRDRAEDPRAVGPAVRGVLGRRPDARPGRGDRAGLAGDRGRARPARRSRAMETAIDGRRARAARG